MAIYLCSPYVLMWHRLDHARHMNSSAVLPLRRSPRISRLAFLDAPNSISLVLLLVLWRNHPISNHLLARKYAISTWNLTNDDHMIPGIRIRSCMKICRSMNTILSCLLLNGNVLSRPVTAYPYQHHRQLRILHTKHVLIYIHFPSSKDANCPSWWALGRVVLYVSQLPVSVFLLYGHHHIVFI